MSDDSPRTTPTEGSTPTSAPTTNTESSTPADSPPEIMVPHEENNGVIKSNNSNSNDNEEPSAALRDAMAPSPGFTDNADEVRNKAMEKHDGNNSNSGNNDNAAAAATEPTSTPAESESESSPPKPKPKAAEPFANTPHPPKVPSRTPSPVALAAMAIETREKSSSPVSSSSSVSSPPPIARSTTPPGSKPADTPPKNNNLFSQWQSKTANAAPVVPGAIPSASGVRPAYSGKRWAPPKQTEETAANKPPMPVKRWSPPKKSSPPTAFLGVASAAAAGAGRPPVVSPKVSPTNSSSNQGRAPSPLPSTPKPSSPAPSTPKHDGSSSSHKPVVQLATNGDREIEYSPARSSASRSSSANNNNNNNNGGKKNVSDIEHELDDLKELKRQLQIATQANGSKDLIKSEFKRTQVEVHADIKELKEDLEIGGIHTSNGPDDRASSLDASLDGRKNNKKKNKNALLGYWQSSTADKAPLRMDEKVPFSGYRPGEVVAAGSATASSSDGKADAGVGVGAALTATATAMATAIDNGDGADSADAVAVHFRSLVETLVRQVMPTEKDHVDELIGEYEGREAELLDTLTAMRENEDLLGQYSEQSSVSSHPDRDGNDGKKKVVVTNALPPPALPTVLSGDDEFVTYEGTPQGSPAKRGVSPLNDPEMEGGEDRKENEKQKVTQHFKDIAQTAAPPRPVTPNPSDRGSLADDASEITELRSNVNRNLGMEGATTGPSAVLNKDTNIGSTMYMGDFDNDPEAQHDGTPVATATPIVDGTAVPNGDDQENKNKGNSDENKKRKRTRLMFVLIAILILAGLGTALGIIFGGKSSDVDDNDKSSAKSKADDGGSSSDFEARDDTDMPTIMDDILNAPQLTTPSPTTEKTPGPTPPPMESLTTACNTARPESKIQELGIRSLNGNYPKVAVDGNQAIVSSGDGYVAFFELDSDNVWIRTEVFSTSNNVGQIESVAIWGDTAVIGAPDATTDFGTDRDQPLKTGAIYIYEKNSLGKWRQLPGAFIPDAYRRATNDEFAEVKFGRSVDIDDGLIVVSAFEESDSQGSITVFKPAGSRGWEQVRHIQPPGGLCDVPHMGHSLQIQGDVIAVSVDCDVNLVLYRITRGIGANGNEIGVSLSQRLEVDDVEFGPISSISMSGDALVYSTFSGGLFFYELYQDHEEGEVPLYVRTQEMTFESDPNLFEYPLAMDGTMLTMSVKNDIYLYTRNPSSKEWEQETLVLESKGDYAGYVVSGAAISNGNLLLASKREVTAHDFTDCSAIKTQADPTTPVTAPTPPTPPTPVTPPITTAPTPPVQTPPVPTLAPTPNPTPAPTQDPTPAPMLDPTPNPTELITAPPTVSPRPPPTPAALDCYTLDISVTLDQYPTDTRWEIIPQGQIAAVATSVPYVASQAFLPAELQSVCLPEGMYDFTIYDVYGDGICCDWGQGSYQLAFGNEVIKTGGSFGLSETIPFSAPGVATTNPPNPPDCYPVYVNLSFDAYSQDESWEISQNGAIVEESPPYAAGLTQEVQELCLPAGDYVFTIYDVYQDGMCCDWGEGSYSVTTINEEVIGGGAEFGPGESTAFTLPTAAMS